MTAATTFAAVDLGSNSFHLLVASTANGQLKVVDRMREMVRLAAGLDAQNHITEVAAERALACLQRFGERVRGMPGGNVRIVGTNTLRKARDAGAFIAHAEAALGHPIDIISGHEEARLIYLGVSHGLEDDAHLRLVIDIGGGSTECILGRHFDPVLMESLHLGCVGISTRFFGDGRIDAKRLRAAEIAACQEFEPIAESFHRIGWQSVIGASGTNLAVRDVVAAAGWGRDSVTREALERLRATLIAAGDVAALTLDGLSAERRPVFPGGVAVLLGAFEELGIGEMRVSDRALREGLIYDLLGRIGREDVRERTIEDLIDRYDVDRAQGARVSATSLAIFDQVAEAWSLGAEEHRRLLHWAAVLHEIGSAISHSQHHKHGGYLLTHLDMAGFARGEQQRLALLVRGHRRKVPLVEFALLPPVVATRMLRLCVILRLAVVLHRRRSEARLPPVTAAVEGAGLRLKFPPKWLAGHPLTTVDLEQEEAYLKAVDCRLRFR